MADRTIHRNAGIPDHITEILAKRHIKYVLAQFVDIHGVAKTTVVPSEHLMEIVDPGCGFEGRALSGFDLPAHSSDLMARGDLHTLTPMPWQPGYARIACVAHLDNEPYHSDSRHVLQKQLQRLKERSWEFNTGIEPEFFLFRKENDGRLIRLDSADKLNQPCYDYKAMAGARGFLEQLVSNLREIDFDIYQIDHEDANGQFEINYAYADALTSADRIILFRMAASEVARQHGVVCSFMPKPHRALTGSGMHHHLSISDSQGKSLFQDDADPQNLGLSPLAYHFLAGLLRHAPALCAFAAPTVNSYKRLVTKGTASGSTWAPVNITYGDNDRSAMVRIPYGRLELRLPDSACNPYLVTAAVIAAGLDGVDNALDPGPAQNTNQHCLSQDIQSEHRLEQLPKTLGAALDALASDPLFSHTMGKGIVAEFLHVKGEEWNDYCSHVSQWETDRYAELF